jgi:hypothetical protein
MRERTFAVLLVVAAVFGSTGVADEPGTGPDSPRYPTPQDCPRFASPEFLSQPLEKAYPGIEYNIRPGVRGGVWPYRFTLEQSPEGMRIDAAKGTVTWTPREEGRVAVSIRATDSAGKSATQSYTLTVAKDGFFFVSPEGDDANPGTIERPWKTVMRAARPPEEFAYPDRAVVVFRGGEYRIDVPSEKGELHGNVVSIRDFSPRYWLAYPGEKPVIDLGWSAEKQKRVLDEQAAAGRAEPSTQGHGHRFALGPGYFYMDGFEVKNACYYMFVMWNGQNTIHMRRCDLHHLWADSRENPAFIFTFSGDRKGEFDAWGVRPRCNAYRNFVIQENRFHDRFYTAERGSHGGAMVFYTVHDSLIEDNDIRDIHRGECFGDKDNGLGNTYRGNVLIGQSSLLGQWNNDETEICHNYVEGELRAGLQPGWLRNIWIHHNTIRGTVSLMGGGTAVPDALDETAGDFSKAATADSARAIREFPVEKRLVHFYRNIVVAPGGEGRDANVILRLPNSKAFAQRWRYVRWDENVVDAAARVELLWNQYTDFEIMKACGFDARGVQVPVALDQEGRQPPDSPWIGRYGREIPGRAPNRP